MPRYSLIVERTDKWTKELVVEAETPDKAIVETEARLKKHGGWDYFFKGDDGDLEDSESRVAAWKELP